MFGGMERMEVPQKLVGETDQGVIRLRMEIEIDLYLHSLGIALRGCVVWAE